MNVFVVSKDVITDCEGNVIDNGGPVAVCTSNDDASDYIDNVGETYMHKRYDYTVEELTIT
jgi:hypothetical protein